MNTPTDVDFGKVIREKRASMKVGREVGRSWIYSSAYNRMTIDQLAKRVKLSRPVVSTIEAGKRSLAATELWTFAEALETTVDELIKLAIKAADARVAAGKKTGRASSSSRVGKPDPFAGPTRGKGKAPAKRRR